MKDAYTNAVLTVIALCLLVLTVQSTFEAAPASAQVALDTAAAEKPTAPKKRPASSRNDVVKVDIARIGGWPVLERSALPVEIESGLPVPVEIEGSGKCGCP